MLVPIDRAWGGGDGGGSGSERASDAASDLSECLAIDPGDAQALMLRAGLKREKGDYEGAFNDLRKAQHVAPDTAGLGDLVTKAAKMALGGGGVGGGGGGGGSGGGGGGGGKAAEFYRLLGAGPARCCLPRHPTAADIACHVIGCHLT